MKIYVRGSKLRKTLDDEAVCIRTYGADMAKKIRFRMAELQAAESLADFWPPKSGPGRIHELKGELTGTFSLDLKHPYRLLFRPIGETTASDRSDEQKRWASITEIEIVGIEDTHG